MILTLAWACLGLLGAGGVGLIAWGLIAEIRDRKACDERPAKYRGVHRKGAVREPYQPPAWATALAEPTDALTEDTQAMPLVELRGEIGRHSSRQLAPVMAGPGWAEWTTAEWRMRNAEVFGEVDAT